MNKTIQAAIPQHTVYYYGDITDGEKKWWKDWIKNVPEFNLPVSYTIHIHKYDHYFSCEAKRVSTKGAIQIFIKDRLNYRFDISYIHKQMFGIFGELG